MLKFKRSSQILQRTPFPPTKLIEHQTIKIPVEKMKKWKDSSNYLAADITRPDKNLC